MKRRELKLEGADPIIPYMNHMENYCWKMFENAPQSARHVGKTENSPF
jgi:hypothetical protein